MAIKSLKSSQKMRIIISGVAIYTTVKQIRYGLFGFTNQRVAAEKALDTLEDMIPGACGLCGTWDGIQIQLDIV